MIWAVVGGAVLVFIGLAYRAIHGNGALKAKLKMHSKAMRKLHKINQQNLEIDEETDRLINNNGHPDRVKHPWIRRK